MSEAGDFTDGEQGDFNYANLPDDGIVGHTLNGASDGVNTVACTCLGPYFLKGLEGSHKCPNGIFFPTIFNSWPNFCKYYKNADPDVQKCLSPSAIDLQGNFSGIIDIYGTLGKCCCTTQVSKKHTPLMRSIFNKNISHFQLLDLKLVMVLQVVPY